MLHIVDSFGRIGEENAFAVLARATELQRQGKDIINLGIGQPDFSTPDHIVEAAIKALRDGHHGYARACRHRGGLGGHHARRIFCHRISCRQNYGRPMVCHQTFWGRIFCRRRVCRLSDARIHRRARRCGFYRVCRMRGGPCGDRLGACPLDHRLFCCHRS